jgi:hypothetical protein
VAAGKINPDSQAGDVVLQIGDALGDPRLGGGDLFAEEQSWFVAFFVGHAATPNRIVPALPTRSVALCRELYSAP